LFVRDSVHRRVERHAIDPGLFRKLADVAAVNLRGHRTDEGMIGLDPIAVIGEGFARRRQKARFQRNDDVLGGRPGAKRRLQAAIDFVVLGALCAGACRNHTEIHHCRQMCGAVSQI
jgi:hypothetical protein